MTPAVSITNSPLAVQIGGTPGPQGVGVLSAQISPDLHLILTLTDGTQVDAGLISPPTVVAQPKIAALGFQPSSARTIVLPAMSTQAALASRGLPPLAFAAKAPVEALDYPIDLSVWLGQDGSSVTDASVQIAPAGDPHDLGISWLAMIGGKLVPFVSGGRGGVTYQIAVTVVTSTLRRAYFVISLPVTSATADTAPDAQLLISSGEIPLLTSQGQYLTDDFGRPLLAFDPTSAPFTAQPLPPNALITPNGQPLMVGASILTL